MSEIQEDKVFKKAKEEPSKDENLLDLKLDGIIADGKAVAIIVMAVFAGRMKGLTAFDSCSNRERRGFTRERRQKVSLGIKKFLLL